MQLNSNSKLAKFYMWLPPDDKKLPEDFCTYFWGLVGRAWFIFVMGGTFLTFVIYWIVVGIITLATLIWAHKIPALIILGCVLFLALVVWLAEREKKVKIEILSEAKMIIRGKVDAVKNRYCPRIEWR